jgi:hypothetical protein
MACNDLYLISVDGAYLKTDAILPFSSAVGEICWQDIGTAQVVLPATDENIRLIVPDKYFVVPNTNGTLYYCHSVKYTDDELWAYGFEAKWLYSKRIVMEALPSGDQSVYSEGMRIINTYADFPFVQPNFGIATKSFAGLEYCSVWDFIDYIQKKCTFGSIMQYNGIAKNAYFNCAAGLDQTGYLRFSLMEGTLKSYELTRSNKTYCNKVYAIGSDNVVETAVDGTPTIEYAAILDLRETYPREDGTSLADYREAVANKAYMSLIARHSTEKLSKAVAAEGVLHPYNLGSLVTVAIPELGVVKACRITKMTAETTTSGNKLTAELTAVRDIS